MQSYQSIHPSIRGRCICVCVHVSVIRTLMINRHPVTRACRSTLPTPEAEPAFRAYDPNLVTRTKARIPTPVPYLCHLRRRCIHTYNRYCTIQHHRNPRNHRERVGSFFFLFFSLLWLIIYLIRYLRSLPVRRGVAWRHHHSANAEKETKVLNPTRSGGENHDLQGV